MKSRKFTYNWDVKNTSWEYLAYIEVFEDGKTEFVHKNKHREITTIWPMSNILRAVESGQWIEIIQKEEKKPTKVYTKEQIKNILSVVYQKLNKDQYIYREEWRGIELLVSELKKNFNITQKIG